MVGTLKETPRLVKNPDARELKHSKKKREKGISGHPHLIPPPGLGLVQRGISPR